MLWPRPPSRKSWGKGVESTSCGGGCLCEVIQDVSVSLCLLACLGHEALRARASRSQGGGRRRRRGRGGGGHGGERSARARGETASKARLLLVSPPHTTTLHHSDTTASLPLTHSTKCPSRSLLQRKTIRRSGEEERATSLPSETVLARARPPAMSKQAPTSDAVQALLELRDKLEKNGRFLTMVGLSVVVLHADAPRAAALDRPTDAPKNHQNPNNKKNRSASRSSAPPRSSAAPSSP